VGLFRFTVLAATPLVEAKACTFSSAALPILASELVTPRDLRISEAVAFSTTILPALRATFGCRVEVFSMPPAAVVFGMPLFYNESRLYRSSVARSFSVSAAVCLTDSTPSRSSSSWPESCWGDCMVTIWSAISWKELKIRSSCPRASAR
jgi:hypothetical protein